uniref:hypothetical protein n=1 Tax=Enorma massiliensis TaxID=1472761 RepID=UPI0034A37A00
MPGDILPRAPLPGDSGTIAPLPGDVPPNDTFPGDMGPRTISCTSYTAYPSSLRFPSGVLQ